MERLLMAIALLAMCFACGQHNVSSSATTGQGDHYQSAILTVVLDSAKVVEAAQKIPYVTVPAPVASRPVTNEGYFMSILGYREKGAANLPRLSHTFAVFARATLGGDNRPVEPFIISWLPKDADIGMGQGIEPGRNFSLEETATLARDNRLAMRRTPIRRITPALFDMAAQRKRALEAGSQDDSIQYKMIDDLAGRIATIQNREDAYTNCIHAVSDALSQRGEPFLDTQTARGFEASELVYVYMSRYVIEPTRDYDAVLAPLLGL